MHSEQKKVLNVQMLNDAWSYNQQNPGYEENIQHRCSFFTQKIYKDREKID